MEFEASWIETEPGGLVQSRCLPSRRVSRGSRRLRSIGRTCSAGPAVFDMCKLGPELLASGMIVGPVLLTPSSSIWPFFLHLEPDGRLSVWAAVAVPRALFVETVQAGHRSR